MNSDPIDTQSVTPTETAPTESRGPIVDDLPEFLTVSEFAALVRRPIGTVYQWNAKGRAPRRTRIGRAALYARSDVVAWLAAQPVS